ncbi:RERG/RAS-like b isoform X2 [Siniperca chuatsi]|uniref:RERG/RAS-like b isoform X2 n=1 Tax=Siniperca chuatsi TaxID=119488 RepID=UPI001CE1C5E4|nr:RERG/RAS-like b isoform X2 [Siniperca chuatsi]
MNDIKLALLGSQGAGKSAVLVRFLTRRFIGEYASNANSLYHKRLSIDGRQLNLEVFDPCSQSSEARCILEEPVDWADGFVVVYNISDRTSFINAKNILRQIREARMDNCKGEMRSADGWRENLQAWPCSFRSVILFGPCVEEELVLARLRTIIRTKGVGCCWDTARANQKGHRSVPLNLTAGEHIPTPI